MEEKSSKQNPSITPQFLLKVVMAKYTWGKPVCCWQEGIFNVMSKQIRYERSMMGCLSMFVFLFPLFWTACGWGGFFPLQILYSFFYLSKVLLQARGRGSQTLRTSRRGQMKMAFRHLGSSLVLEETVYSQMCYSCCLVWFLSLLLFIDIQGALRRWTFLFTGDIIKHLFLYV